MAINTRFQQQRPLGWSASVRSAPSQRPGARLTPGASSKPAAEVEQKSFAPKLER